MLVVYRTTSSLRGGHIYKRVDIIAVRVWSLLQTCTFYILTITFYQDQQYM